MNYIKMISLANSIVYISMTAEGHNFSEKSELAEFATRVKIKIQELKNGNKTDNY